MPRAHARRKLPGGYTPLHDRTCLDRIALLMDRQEWSADTLDDIAEVLRTAGYLIEDPP